MEAFTEDWNASQFWYSDETATVLAKQLLDGATDETRIAVVSAPSAFIQLKNLIVGVFGIWGRERGHVDKRLEFRRSQVSATDQIARIRRPLCSFQRVCPVRL